MYSGEEARKRVWTRGRAQELSTSKLTAEAWATCKLDYSYCSQGILLVRKVWRSLLITARRTTQTHSHPFTAFLKSLWSSSLFNHFEQPPDPRGCCRWCCEASRSGRDWGGAEHRSSYTHLSRRWQTCRIWFLGKQTHLGTPDQGTKSEIFSSGRFYSVQMRKRCAVHINTPNSPATTGSHRRKPSG